MVGKRMAARAARQKQATESNENNEQRKVARKEKKNAQSLIHYEAITESGIAYLGGNKYSITLQLSDIDYQLAPNEVQEGLVEKYARFLNGHLAGHHVQVSIVNRVLDKAQLMESIELSSQDDGFDSQRDEYNQLISRRLESGRNNTVTEKYVTLQIEAESFEEAKIVLSRMAAEDIAALREVGGCRAEQISGDQRVRLLQQMLRPDAPNDFSYADMVGQKKAKTKDFVAPWSIDRSDSDRLVLYSGEDRYWQTMILRKMPNWMSDRVLKELAEIPADLTVSIHFDPLDQAEGLDLVKRQIAGMDIQMANERRKLAKQNMDIDLVPHELEASHTEAVELRQQLEQSNEKLFTTRIIIGVSAGSQEELEEAVKRVRRVAGKHSCSLENLRYMQIDGLNACLPLGLCKIPMYRTLTTAVGAVMIPFTTQELLERSGNFYGINALSKNVIMADRAKGMNSNGFILGTTGSGKSQFAKFEMNQTFLRRPNDEILIIDPEREYPALAKEMKATTVVISAGSEDAINPMDLSKEFTNVSDGDPVRNKCGFVLSLCEVLLGGADGLTPAKRSIIDRVVASLYSTYWTSDIPAPTLKDLYEALRHEPEAEAQEVATGLEMYARGSAQGFARQTNVDASNRVTIYDIAELSKDLQTFGMMVVLEEIWARIVRNKARGVRTWVYIDEFHLLFNNDYAGAYCQSMFKRVRKYGAAATGITQNIEELLINERARLMLSNSDGLFLLNQQSTDADALASLLHLSNQQRGYFTNVEPGRGLMKVGKAVIPFDNTMDSTQRIFKVFSTRFEEVSSF
ncbi:ATP-binding protein [Arcanobacterium phocisimile]|uniref:ATP-binding protein n=1 Tax=Arcanobacterium phocisimile TaxID=1302235 RepID=A0ABX7IHZ2_9ACTO|nr:DUF87 domain-containing protein [Arcanobacterium phocisimile]QRV02069.1 ATP-binding protein [Arcanobacterium phocisimile]